MANSVDSGVGGIINFCLPDAVYQIGQAAIRISIPEEVSYAQ